MELRVVSPLSKLDAGFCETLPATVIVINEVADPFALYSLIERVKRGELNLPSDN